MGKSVCFKCSNISDGDGLHDEWGLMPSNCCQTFCFCRIRNNNVNPNSNTDCIIVIISFLYHYIYSAWYIFITKLFDTQHITCSDMQTTYIQTISILLSINSICNCRLSVSLHYIFIVVHYLFWFNEPIFIIINPYFIK